MYFWEVIFCYENRLRQGDKISLIICLIEHLITDTNEIVKFPRPSSSFQRSNTSPHFIRLSPCHAWPYWSFLITYNIYIYLYFVTLIFITSFFLLAPSLIIFLIYRMAARQLDRTNWIHSPYWWSIWSKESTISVRFHYLMTEMIPNVTVSISNGYLLE